MKGFLLALQTISIKKDVYPSLKIFEETGNEDIIQGQ